MATQVKITSLSEPQFWRGTKMAETITKRVIFDADDVDYMVTHLTMEQLRKEIGSRGVQRAYTFKERWSNYMGAEEHYWYDFGKACELALDIQRSMQPQRPSYEGKLSIQAVKEANDIVEVVNRYTKLRKSGQECTGKCPFHTDRQPSLNVNPAKQIFHCFSCNQAGDVIDFIKLVENINTAQAIEFLGGNINQRVGIKL